MGVQLGAVRREQPRSLTRREHLERPTDANEQALADPWRHAATRANGQLAIGCYSLSADGARYLPGVLDGFVTPEVFPSFGLPDSLPLAS